MITYTSDTSPADGTAPTPVTANVAVAPDASGPTLTPPVPSWVSSTFTELIGKNWPGSGISPPDPVAASAVPGPATALAVSRPAINSLVTARRPAHRRAPARRSRPDARRPHQDSAYSAVSGSTILIRSPIRCVAECESGSISPQEMTHIDPQITTVLVLTDPAIVPWIQVRSEPRFYAMAFYLLVGA